MASQKFPPHKKTSADRTRQDTPTQPPVDMGDGAHDTASVWERRVVPVPSLSQLHRGSCRDLITNDSLTATTLHFTLNQATFTRNAMSHSTNAISGSRAGSRRCPSGASGRALRIEFQSEFRLKPPQLKSRCWDGPSCCYPDGFHNSRRTRGGPCCDAHKVPTAANCQLPTYLAIGLRSGDESITAIGR